jgi:hypothetical protein
LVTHSERITYIEEVSEEGTEKNIWTYEGGSNTRLKEIANEELHNLYTSPDVIRVIK